MSIKVTECKHPGVYKVSNIAIASPSLAEPSLIYRNSKSDNYGVYVLIPKECKEATQALEEIITTAAHDNFGKKTQYMNPLRDGDDQLDKDGKPIASPKAYRFNHWHFKCKTPSKPQIKTLSGDNADPKEFYTNCMANVWFQVNAFTSKVYNTSYVMLDLVAVQKVGDGERVDEYAPPVMDDSEFKDLSDDKEVNDNFDDLMGD